MFDELSQDIKRAAGSTDTSASLDPVWLRAHQMQRRRAVLFASVAAMFSIVAVMAVGAIRSVEPPPGVPVAFPAESFDTRMVTVPDVVGLRVTRAREVLRAQGLKAEDARTIDCNPYTVRTTGKKSRRVTIDVEQIGAKSKEHVVFCTVIEPTFIVKQFPVAGSEVEEGTVVDLTFGPRMRSGVRITVDDMTELDD